MSADAATDAAADADGGACCPADPTPGCCMSYGGWKAAGASCGKRCDGMPVSTDPGWKLENDSHGCPRWTHPDDFPKHAVGVSYCGAVAPNDAGADASADAP